MNTELDNTVELTGIDLPSLTTPSEKLLRRVKHYREFYTRGSTSKTMLGCLLEDAEELAAEVDKYRTEARQLRELYARARGKIAELEAALETEQSLRRYVSSGGNGRARVEALKGSS